MDGLLTSTQVAERLGVERHMVCRLIEHGLLPAYRIGLVYLVSEEDLDGFVAASATPTQA